MQESHASDSTFTSNISFDLSCFLSAELNAVSLYTHLSWIILYCQPLPPLGWKFLIFRALRIALEHI